MGFVASILRLIKYKLSLAVTLSAAAGFFLYPNPENSDLIPLLAGVFLLSGGAAALNQYQERSRDGLMERTRMRPIPSGKITPATALGLASGFIAGGSLVLSLTGILPPLLGLLNVLLYNGLYTPLKPRTAFAVLPGGLVGAIPPMIGWTAAGGPPFAPGILFAATLLFLWQMPHFWLLAIRYADDYEKAGFPTLSRQMSQAQIRRLVFLWMTVSLIFLLSAPVFGIDLRTWVWIVLGVVNLAMIATFYLILFRTSSPAMLRVVFILTNIVLTIILLGLIANALIG